MVGPGQKHAGPDATRYRARKEVGEGEKGEKEKEEEQEQQEKDEEGK